MAVIKAVSSKAGIGQAIDYVTKEEKTEAVSYTHLDVYKRQRQRRSLSAVCIVKQRQQRRKCRLPRNYGRNCLLYTSRCV